MKRKSLGMREQMALLQSVESLLISAESPTRVTTASAFCGRYELENLKRVHKDMADKFYMRKSLSGDASGQ